MPVSETPSLLTNFKQLYAKHYGKELDDFEAQKILTALGNLLLLADDGEAGRILLSKDINPP